MNFTRIFLLPFKALRNSKIQYFQFRFLHRILGINSFLFRIGLTDSPRCSFCADCEETLSHLFWDCSIINRFWHDACNNCIKHPSDILLNKELIFFGNVLNMSSPLNFFILHVKHYIYSCRVLKSTPTLTYFKRLFAFYLNVETAIDSLRNKTSTLHDFFVIQ